MPRKAKKKQVPVKVYKNCEYCDNKFEQKTSRQRFCCQRCQIAYFKKNAKYKTVCPKCLEEIEVAVYSLEKNPK